MKSTIRPTKTIDLLAQNEAKKKKKTSLAGFEAGKRLFTSLKKSSNKRELQNEDAGSTRGQKAKYHLGGAGPEDSYSFYDGAF